MATARHPAVAVGGRSATSPPAHLRTRLGATLQIHRSPLTQRLPAAQLVRKPTGHEKKPAPHRQRVCRPMRADLPRTIRRVSDPQIPLTRQNLRCRLTEQRDGFRGSDIMGFLREQVSHTALGLSACGKRKASPGSASNAITPARKVSSTTPIARSNPLNHFRCHGAGRKRCLLRGKEAIPAMASACRFSCCSVSASSAVSSVSWYAGRSRAKRSRS